MTRYEKCERRTLSDQFELCASDIDKFMAGKYPPNMSMGLLSRLIAIKEALIEVSRELVEV